MDATTETQKPLAKPGSLASLMAFNEAVDRVRSQGGPVAALAALMQQPLQIGARTFHPMTASVAIFINSVYGEDGLAEITEPVEILKLALAFQAPERCAAYLTFGRTLEVNHEALARDAFTLGASMSKEDLGVLGQWCLAQISGPALLMVGMGAEAEEGASPLAPGVPAPQAGPDGCQP